MKFEQHCPFFHSTIAAMADSWEYSDVNLSKTSHFFVASPASLHGSVFILMTGWLAKIISLSTVSSYPVPVVIG